MRFVFLTVISLFAAPVLLLANENSPLNTFIPPNSYALPEEITYEQFIKWREDKNTVVLDSFSLEPFFHIAPEAEAKESENVYSQKQLDKLLTELIPQKNTRIILYCHQNFQPTRLAAAFNTVGSALLANGFTNVHRLEKLWLREDMGNNLDKIRSIAEKEIKPYTQVIPQKYLISD